MKMLKSHLHIPSKNKIQLTALICVMMLFSPPKWLDIIVKVNLYTLFKGVKTNN